jgi:hypothetical protein
LSAYQNFVKDFPQRCRRVLREYGKSAEKRDLEVTLLLTVASAALVIPYERLNHRKKRHVASDRTPDAVTKLTEFEAQKFNDVFAGDSWRIIPELPEELVIGKEVDQWATPSLQKSIHAEKKIGEVFPIIRNALAHGALFIHPILDQAGTRPSIGHLVFVSEHWEQDENGRYRPTDRYNAILVSPNDFQAMLYRWLDFLDTLPFSPQEI